LDIFSLSTAQSHIWLKADVATLGQDEVQAYLQHHIAHQENSSQQTSVWCLDADGILLLCSWLVYERGS